jgi:hypothetical protein
LAVIPGSFWDELMNMQVEFVIKIFRPFFDQTRLVEKHQDMSDVVVENRLVEKESNGYHDDVGDTTLVLEFAVLLKILK